MKNDVFRLILSIISSLFITELFMSKAILKFYKFKGIFIGHVLIFYVVFLITFTLMKFILGIAGSKNLDPDQLEEELNEMKRNFED